MIPLLAGLAIGLGNVISGATSAAAQDRANEANAAEAERNRQFQSHMSETAVQRRMRDLDYAGLNPILAATDGASTPSGSTANHQAANPLQGLGSGVTGGISTALQVSENAAKVANLDQQNGLIAAQKAHEDVKQTLTANSASEAAAKTERMRAELPSVEAKARFDKKQAEINSEMINYDNTIDRAQKAANLGSTAMDMVNPLGKILGKGNRADGKAEKLIDMLMNPKKTKGQLP